MTLNVANLVAAVPRPARWLLVAALAVAIFSLSVVPGKPRLGDSAFVWAVAETPTLLQKTMHIILYGLLTMLLIWAMESQRRSNSGASILATLLAIAFGASLEWAQLHVPGRFGNIYDVGLNGAGAICGLLIASRLRSDRKSRLSAHSTELE